MAKKLTLALLFALLAFVPARAFTGIVWDTALFSSTTVGNSTTGNIPYTMSSGSGGLLVACVTTGVANAPTATYAGVAMTNVGTNTSISGYGVFMFYKVSPAAGANNLVVTLGSGLNLIEVSASSYTGVGTLGPENAISSGTAVAAPVTVAHSTVADNAWGVACFGSSTASAPTVNSGSPNTRAVGVDISGFASGAIYDSSAISPAGSYTFDITDNGFNGMLVASFAPATGGGPTFPAAIIGAPIICCGRRHVR